MLRIGLYHARRSVSTAILVGLGAADAIICRFLTYNLRSGATPLTSASAQSAFTTRANWYPNSFRSLPLVEATLRPLLKGRGANLAYGGYL